MNSGVPGAGPASGSPYSRAIYFMSSSHHSVPALTLLSNAAPGFDSHWQKTPETRHSRAAPPLVWPQPGTAESG